MTEYIDPQSPSIRKLSVHIQSQKAPPAPKFKVNIESLHTCLVSQGVTRLSIEDIRSAVEKGDAGEASIEANLRTLLSDESKADEAEIESLMAKLVLAMRETDNSNGPFVNVDNQKTARRLSMVDGKVPEASESTSTSISTRDHTKLPEGNKLITNVIDFKSSVELSPAAVPLIDF
jgi:insulysin